MTITREAGIKCHNYTMCSPWNWHTFSVDSLPCN